MGGHDPYSASKGCAELVFAAYLKSFFSKSSSDVSRIGSASVRAGNVIGGGDWGKDRIIPDCVRALSANKPIGIRNMEAMRPWQHVLEPLSGYLWLGALLYDFPEKYSGPWNFGPNGADHLKVRELVQKFINLWGSGSIVDLSPNNFTSQSAPHEATVLRLCCDKAQTYLGWQPTLKVDECLHLTTEWYKLFYSNDSKVDMFPLCCDQIRNYTQKAKERSLRWATE
jgi:CDP-glucose 4,6-dehydratase